MEAGHIMRRVNNLFPEVCSFSRLVVSARKARKGNRHSEEANRFWYFLEKEILQLKEELEAQIYQPGPYRYFLIQDPKERIISVAPFRDRVVHHAVVGTIEPVFEKCFIADSYACRTGKGTHRAVFQAQAYLRHNRWFFKSDIEHFFDSVDHKILAGLLERKIKDKKLLDLIASILANGGKDGKGLPIGNLTSQFFANVYLNAFDHFVKEEMRVRHYIRYMDDFVIFHPEKERLKELRKGVEGFLEEKLQLSLKPTATFFNQQPNGLPFLGTRIFPSMIRIRKPSLKRCLGRLKERQHAYAQGRIEMEALVQSTSSIIGHLASYDTLALRQAFFEGYGRKGL